MLLHFQSLYTKTNFLLIKPTLLSGLILSISGCQLDSNTEIVDASNADPALVADNIRANIVNSYAAIASQKSDICPKLIQREVDSPAIHRKSEVMTDYSCDYYLYPKAGSIINVTTNSDQIEALLITPSTYNFSNGHYQTTSYDKHVIRLNYIGAQHKPDRLSYDIVVSIVE